MLLLLPGGYWGSRSLSRGVSVLVGDWSPFKGLVSVQGVGLRPGGSPSKGSPSRGFPSRGVSVQGRLHPGSLLPGESLSVGSLSKGVSVQGGLCPLGLCTGGPLSREGSLSKGVSIKRGVSVQGVSVKRGVSVQEVSVKSRSVEGGNCLGRPVQWISVQGDLCQGDTPPDRDSPYGNEWMVHILLACILIIAQFFEK